MGSVEKNLGFIFNSRLLDSLLTLACLTLAVLGFAVDHEILIGFAVPGAIGLFRQFVPLLTFPFVVSVGLLGIWLLASAQAWI
ncbi:MAG: hypothetical protein D6703_01440 [Zetaproteobacteria bacterium]|nr:MAG: hypothetical protein D6703_01440 [Zetaproteobacteria bacterium]